MPVRVVRVLGRRVLVAFGHVPHLQGDSFIELCGFCRWLGMR